MTNILPSEVEEIFELIERESFRSDGTPWIFDFRKSIVYAQYYNLREFLEKTIKKKGMGKSVLLFSTEEKNPRQLTIKKATKKLFFSETVLLFHPEYGLILKATCWS